MRRFCLVAVLLSAACTAPPESAEFPAVASFEIEPPVFEYLHVSDAAPEPEPPLGIVGPNPGCPRMRVFTDAEDLCRRGIMPLVPHGGCARMLQSDEPEPESFASAIVADRVEVPALSGHAELFVRHYIRSDDRDLIYLALRGSNGYVLLAHVGEYFSQSNNPPKFERVVGDAAGVEVTTLQQWWLHEEPYERLVRETTRCTLDAGGRLRCDGECPTLALAGSPPPLDCAALASFDWGTLSRGRDVLDEWGGWDDEFQQEVAEDHVGIEGADYHPVAIRRIEVGDRTLTVLEPVPDKWVLLHEHVPLLASSQPIRVGLAPGGVYASSSSDGAQRIHRLLLDTHEIEPVLPGPCG